MLDAGCRMPHGFRDRAAMIHAAMMRDAKLRALVEHIYTVGVVHYPFALSRVAAPRTK